MKKPISLKTKVIAAAATFITLRMVSSQLTELAENLTATMAQAPALLQKAEEPMPLLDCFHSVANWIANPQPLAVERSQLRSVIRACSAAVNSL